MVERSARWVSACSGFDCGRLESRVTEFGKRKGGGRRSAARRNAPLIAIVSTVMQTQRATLVDISCSGARLVGHDLPEIGEHFILRIEAMQAFATVVWSKEDQRGVRFESPLADEEVELLRRAAGSPSLASLTPEEKLALDDWITGNR